MQTSGERQQTSGERSTQVLYLSENRNTMVWKYTVIRKGPEFKM